MLLKFLFLKDHIRKPIIKKSEHFDGKKNNLFEYIVFIKNNFKYNPFSTAG